MNYIIQIIKTKRSYVFLTVILLILFSIKTSAQERKVLKRIYGVYKSKLNGRIISQKEFNSYKGVYTFHKLIKDKNGNGKDTILITPPNKKMRKNEYAIKTNFKTQVGKKAKDFQATDLFGNKISSKDLKGKIVVLNFWFVNCPPCKDEIPELNKIVAEYKNNKGIVFIGFALDKKDKLNGFLSQTQFDYKIVPNSKDIANQYFVYAYPSHIIINKNGIISYTDIGLKEGSISLLSSEITNTLNN